MATKLTSVQLRGWRSIADAWEPALRIGDINVLVGANGAGKSNLLSFFALLNAMMEGRLGEFVGLAGGADSQLTGGAWLSPVCTARLEFRSDSGTNAYGFSLAHAANNTFLFTDEYCEYEHQSSRPAKPFHVALGAGHFESRLRAASLDEGPEGKTASFIRSTLLGWRAYHFHDTSSRAGIKQHSEAGDNLYLRADASNLAAFLLRLRDESAESYERIRATINLAAPFFEDFVLEVEGRGASRVQLRWRQKGDDVVYGPHQISDGTLRFMCLTTLLCQPNLPRLIVIDEPELGLHPYAIQLLGEMLKDAAERAQVLVATQSPVLVDASASVEDLIVVEHVAGRSRFLRKEEKDLQAWLEDYSLGQIWMKNLLGGGPQA